MNIVHNIKNSNINLDKKVYQCTYCSSLFNWNENSSWFGSVKEMDNQEIKYFSCSDNCMDNLKIETDKL